MKFKNVKSILESLVKEALLSDLEKAKSEIPKPEFEEVGETNTSHEEFERWGDENVLPMGKYSFKNNDSCGKHWKQGDIVDINEPKSPIKSIGDEKAYEIVVNNISIYISKDFLEPVSDQPVNLPSKIPSLLSNSDIEMEIDEDEGSGDAGMAGTTTSDVGGYATPFSKSVKRRKKPDTFWSEEELDEDGTDFSWSWNDKDKLPEIDNNLKKKLKVHSPELKPN